MKHFFYNVNPICKPLSVIFKGEGEKSTKNESPAPGKWFISTENPPSAEKSSRRTGAFRRKRDNPEPKWVFPGNLDNPLVFCCRITECGTKCRGREKTGAAAEKVPGKICSFYSGVLHSKGENSKMRERKKDRKEKRRESPWCLWCVRWD